MLNTTCQSLGKQCALFLLGTERLWREAGHAWPCDVCGVILVVSCEEEQGFFSQLSCPKPFKSTSLFLMFFSISASRTLMWVSI